MTRLSEHDSHVEQLENGRWQAYDEVSLPLSEHDTEEEALLAIKQYVEFLNTPVEKV